MSAGSIITPAAKAWAYPVIGLCIVGAPALAVGWSHVFSTGVGQGAGIIVHDLPQLGSSFQAGQDLADKQHPNATTPDAGAAAKG